MQNVYQIIVSEISAMEPILLKVTEKPKVSVIIPIFNRTEEIGNIIQSLNAQTFKDFEVIFVDDSSLIPLIEILEKYHKKIEFPFLVYRNQINKGVSYSRNTGVSKSNGKYISFLDSDDYWQPHKLSTCIKGVQDLAGDIFLMSKTKVVRDEHIKILPKGNFTLSDSGDKYLFEEGQFAQISSFFLSKSLAEKIQFYVELKQYEDYMYFIDALKLSQHTVFIDEVLVTWNDKTNHLRLSNNRTFIQALDFIRFASNKIENKSLRLFYLRFVMPYYFYFSFRNSLATIIYCTFNSKIHKKTVLWLTLRGLLGPHVISKLKSLFKNG